MKNTFKLITYNFKTLLLFELLYKLIITVVFTPLSLFIFNTTMKLTGYTYLTLENIGSFLLNPITILILILLLIFIAIVTLFDISTMIVIFDAYKFGLATLHQLRGRVGRNSYDSYCILVTNRESKRLDIMESVNDGFKLAEEDFKLRGSGDLFGTKQSGDMNFKIANLTKDYNILLQAKEDSDIILKEIDNYIVLKDILKKSINRD